MSAEGTMEPGPKECIVPAASPAPREYSILYAAVVIHVILHSGGLYGLYLSFTSAKWATIIFNAILYACAILGTMAGAHRLWSHRSYKAKLPLQIILMLFQTMTYTRSAYHFSRDHRLHHKHSDTDADPCNPTRGLFYAHIGWVIVKKHPDAIRKGRTIDVSDLRANSVLQFQRKYYFYLSTIIVFLLPTLIPVYCWDETLNNAHHISLLRVIVVLNVIFSTNSVIHQYGSRPYEKRIMPTQNLFVNLITLGEGFHNFHHVFPFDYRGAEPGKNYVNFTTKFIEFFVWVGWVYDLKSASPGVVAKRADRTGDGTDLWGRKKEDKEGLKSEQIRKNLYRG